MQIESNIKFLEVEDYSVSNEKFELYLDPSYHLLKTIPQPKSEELGKYYESENYISHTDKKTTFFEKVYQTIKRKAIQNKLNLLESIKESKGNLLDIGCGTGDFLAAAKNRNWNVLGYEPNVGARKLAEEKGVSIVEDTKSIEEGTLDIITLWHVFEHVPDLENQIKELYRLLKPNGILIIAVPNYKSYDAQYYGKHWAAYDVPRHLWHFSQQSIPLLFNPFGFILQDTYPMLFDSFYVSLLSEEIKHGKKNWLKAFSVGLKSNIEARRNLEYSSLIYSLKKTI